MVVMVMTTMFTIMMPTTVRRHPRRWYWWDIGRILSGVMDLTPRFNSDDNMHSIHPPNYPPTLTLCIKWMPPLTPVWYFIKIWHACFDKFYVSNLNFILTFISQLLTVPKALSVLYTMVLVLLDRRNLTKTLNFITSLTQFLQNHVDFLLRERTPALRDQVSQWSLYTGFTVSYILRIWRWLHHHDSH